MKPDKEFFRKAVIPNFLAIGAPKCGTTWLSEVLRKHPDVFIAHGKELVYFASEKKFSNGDEWYLDFFTDVSNQSAVGEISVSYMGAGKVAAERIYKFNQDMKLIAILRDPVRRAYSHHRWLMQLGKEKSKSFLDALQKDPNIVRDSSYFRNLEPYWALFPKENILILKFEDIKNNGMELQRRVFEFLGVEANFDSGLTKKVVGKTINPKSRMLENLRIKTHTFVRKNNLSFLISLFKRSRLSSLYRKLNNKDNVGIGKDEYLKAVLYFSDDVAHLSEHVSFDCSDWLVWKDNDEKS